MEEAKLVCHRSRSDKADFEMEIKALWRGKMTVFFNRRNINPLMLIHLHFYVLALFQPGTSEVKYSDSYFLKEFVFMLKLSQSRKFLSKNEQNSGIFGCLQAAPKLLLRAS